jgi:hypothetical protein
VRNGQKLCLSSGDDHSLTRPQKKKNCPWLENNILLHRCPFNIEQQKQKILLAIFDTTPRFSFYCRLCYGWLAPPASVALCRMSSITQQTIATVALLQLACTGAAGVGTFVDCASNTER